MNLMAAFLILVLIWLSILPVFPLSLAAGSTLTGTGTYTVQGISDDGEGSGVGYVDIAIQDARGNYWNGTDYVSTETWLLAAGTTSWSYSWQLPTSDGGAYTIQARATDNASNTGPNSATYNITVDNVPPTINRFVINNNDTYTKSARVNLNSDVSGATEMRFANSLTELSSASYVAYSSTYSYSLPTGDAIKTVYTQYRDSAGNETTYIFDDIILDTNSIEASITDPVSGSTLTGISGTLYTITGTADDAGGSGVGYVDIAIQDAGGNYWNGSDYVSTETWLPASGTTSWSYHWSLPTSDGGAYTIQARVTDNANNTDPTAATSNIFVDNVSTTITSFVINNNDTYTKLTNVTLNSDVSGATEMRFANSKAELASATYQVYFCVTHYTLPAQDGIRTVYAEYRDAANNTCSTADSIILRQTYCKSRPNKPRKK